MKRSVDRFGQDGQGKLPVNGLVRIRLESDGQDPRSSLWVAYMVMS